MKNANVAQKYIFAKYLTAIVSVPSTPLRVRTFAKDERERSRNVFTKKKPLN
jgi:hypothetical protein